MRANSKVLCVGAIALMLGADLATAADSGFYVSANFGQSRFDVDGNYKQRVSESGTQFDESDTTWSVAAGYRFNPYVGLELGYTDFGEVTESADYSGTHFELARGATGIQAAGRIAIPVSNFEFSAKLGVMRVVAEVEGRSPNVYSYGFDTSGPEVFYSLGAAYIFADHYLLGVEWSALTGVVDTDEVRLKSVQSITAGFAYRF